MQFVWRYSVVWERDLKSSFGWRVRPICLSSFQYLFMQVLKFVSLFILGSHHQLMIWLNHWANICYLGNSFVNDLQYMIEVVLICMKDCSARPVPRREVEESQETETWMCFLRRAKNYQLKCEMFLKKCFFFNGQCQMFAHTLRDYLLRSEKECSFDVFFSGFQFRFSVS